MMIDENDRRIESVEFIYNGNENDFTAFLKAVYTDYFTQKIIPFERSTDEENNGKKRVIYESPSEYQLDA